MSTNKKENRRLKIKYRVRKKVYGSDEKPRLSVFRSNKQIYAQLIDDDKGATIVSASS
jgi:large subunit ribosomal protein L18